MPPEQPPPRWIELHLTDLTPVGEDRMLLQRKPIDFDVNGHPPTAAVELAYGGFGARSTLHVDGR